MYNSCTKYVCLSLFDRYMNTDTTHNNEYVCVIWGFNTLLDLMLKLHFSKQLCNHVAMLLPLLGLLTKNGAGQ